MLGIRQGGGNRNKKNKNQKGKGKKKNASISSNNNASLLERLLKKSIEKERECNIAMLQAFCRERLLRTRPNSNIVEPKT